MPSTIGTYVTSNYLKASPSSRFGTRELSIFVVQGLDGVETNSADSGSLFSQAVRALQQNVEIWWVGAPASGAFSVVVSKGTAQNAAAVAELGSDGNNGENANALTLQQVLRTATGDANCTVAEFAFSGSGLTSV